jgi:hypothetical protein
MKEPRNWDITILAIIIILIIFVWHPWSNGSESTNNVTDSTKKVVTTDTTKKATVAVDTTKNPCPCPKKKVKKSVASNPSKQTKTGQATQKIPTQRVEIIIKQEGVVATTSQQIVAAPQQFSSSVSTAAAPSSVVSTLCGLDNYVVFSVRLNDNDGNYFPQIAYDRDGKTFNHAVSNPTKDGLNFRFLLSEFVDAPTNGDVCVTKDGRICIPASYVADYIGPEKIIKVILWSGTVRGFHQMTLVGDNYIWQK